MSGLMVTLTEEQHEYLRAILQRELERTRVEYRRTDTPAFREVVAHEEELLRKMLKSLEDAHVDAG